MKRLTMALVGLAVAAGLLMPAGMAQAGTSAPAAAAYHQALTVPSALGDVTNEILCDNAGDSVSCLAPFDSGPITPGESVTTNTGRQLNEDTIGTVNENNGTPFNISSCDKRYNGHTIVLLEWTSAPGEYLRNDHTDGDLIVVSGTEDNASEWVKSGTWYINVAATDDAGVNCNTQNPYILTWRPNTAEVWSACGGCYDFAKQNWAAVP
jgi:hypothetical protein